MAQAAFSGGTRRAPRCVGVGGYRDRADGTLSTPKPQPQQPVHLPTAAHVPLVKCSTSTCPALPSCPALCATSTPPQTRTLDRLAAALYHHKWLALTWKVLGSSLAGLRPGGTGPAAAGTALLLWGWHRLLQPRCCCCHCRWEAWVLVPMGRWRCKHNSRQRHNKE